ncbi:Ubiquitin carboxyl-terminal hydrolase MINDY-2 [Saguinus oedipus]|uniref:Ubiquitin carboxyl-terminal hydrolase n=1 Tax=Saguinus oedipus TaxID=9490 RepID=A0ABQ9UH01_SAGOE|nr:Ubiquitin carboxyl-terminal hydrolase MINDY-2 [Saguinus oedipus]
MESSPESLQPLEHEVAARPASGIGSSQEGLQETRLAAGDGPGVWAVESGGGNWQRASAARRSLQDSASPLSSSTVPGPCISAPGLDLKDGALESPAAAEVPLRGQYKLTASHETAEAEVGHDLGSAGDAEVGTDLASSCQAEVTAAGSQEPSSAGGLSSSCCDPSPAGELLSLDSLESFSNLYSFPSSSEFNSEEGAESRVSEEEEEDGAAVLPGAVPLCKEEETAQVLAASKECFPGQSVYHIKWIQWKEENTPIITQNENGSCPLLAILNVFLLVWNEKLPLMMEIITAEQLMKYLGDYMLDEKPKEILEIQRLN